MRRIHTGALRASRERLGLRQCDVADSIGVTRGYYSRLEAGTRQGTPRTVLLLAERLGTTVDEITYPVPATSAA